MTDQDQASRIITIKGEPERVFTRWPCDLCGGGTDKEAVTYRFADPDDGSRCVACHSCIDATPEQRQDRIREHAERLEAHAAFIRRALLGTRFEIERPAAADVPF